MLKLEDRIDNMFRIETKLGIGGMAEVYQALYIPTGKMVAFKILKEELVNDEVQVARFNYEADLCAISNHSNIIKVLYKGTYEDRPYLVYDLMHGKTLAEKISERAYIQLEEACYIMICLCEAFQYLHDHKVVHRDIKPDNIFYMLNGEVKIVDFGISFDMKHPQEKDKGTFGSIQYMAPELCKGHMPTPQSDIYALGITFFEMITGTVPFGDGTAQDIAKAHIKKPLPSVHEYNPELNKNVDYIISKACAKKVEDRYASCEEFKQDIIKLRDNKDNFVQKRNIIKRIFGLK